MTIWIDLTNSIEKWQGGIVGIVRTELMLAKELSQLDPTVKFSKCTSIGFCEVHPSEIEWLLRSENLSEDYSNFQKVRNEQSYISQKINYRSQKIKSYIGRKVFGKPCKILHPYNNGDVVFSCGWFGSKKEDFFSKVKASLPGLKIVYMVYDIIMIKEGIRHFYYPNDLTFEVYLKWVSDNCDAILYCGQTAQKDTEEFLRERGWKVPIGQWIEFGSDISPKNNKENISKVLEKYQINRSYILCVGSFEPRKNYKVLYQAYCMMALERFNALPDLVICGQNFADKDLYEQIKTNPLTKEKIKIHSFTDDELEVLYQNCEFAALPSLYEGRSVVLSEILDHGKLCLCSRVPPLIELGQDLPYYLDPKHPREWCDAIKKFSSNFDERRKFENKVKDKWKPVSWKACANTVYKNLLKISDTDVFTGNPYQGSSLYIDISLFFFEGGLSGIPRAQLLLARHISKINSKVRFFSLHKNKYIEVPRFYLKQTLGENPLDISIKHDRENFPSELIHKDSPFPFKEGDVVFSAGVGFGEDTYNALKELHNQKHFTFVQLVYDFTPILTPHTHHPETLKNFPKFLKWTYELSDYIIYGGKVAQKDGDDYQNHIINKIPTPSFAIKFGSDIRSFKTTSDKVESVLSKYGITGDFLLTVGTIEARKNHDLLYEAYLELLRDDELKKVPQLIICGHPGWKTEDFQHRIKVDVRIFGKVKIITPSDEELDILYKNCLFTLLASFYEGWSLTLPESLNYGKMCIAADVPPLREVGEDIIEYANPYDPVDWAEKIKYYLNEPEQIVFREKLISLKWKNTTWSDCADEVNNILDSLQKKSQRIQ